MEVIKLKANLNDGLAVLYTFFSGAFCGMAAVNLYMPGLKFLALLSGMCGLICLGIALNRILASEIDKLTGRVDILETPIYDHTKKPIRKLRS